MCHKLDFRVLMRLHRRSLQNGEEDALVERNLQRSDEQAEALSPNLQADYAALKRFFNNLPFHEVHTRTYSWISDARQVFFFYPTISRVAGPAGIMQPSISMFVRADHHDAAFRLALGGLGVGWDDIGSREIIITSQKMLDEYLSVVDRFHEGYILPDAVAWQALQQARRTSEPRGYCPVLLPCHPANVPDCWL